MNTKPLLNNKVNSIIELYSNGSIKESIDEVEILISNYPNESLLFNIRGVCYKAIGQLDVAVKSFEKAITIKPDFADAYYNLGLTLQELNQLDVAIKHYEEALVIEPNYAKAHNNLGIIHKELGKMDDAVKSYEQVLSIQPDNAEAHNNLGNTLFELGKLDDAVKSYKQALVIHPDYVEVHNNLGNIFNELGQTDDALNSYNQAVSIDPNHADAHNNIGIILEELGQLDEAIECYEKAIAINPEYAEAHNNLGIILAELDQLDEAVNFYKKALTINPNYDEAHYNLGRSLYKLGQTDEALNCYKQALAINPDYTSAHNNLGTIHIDLGQTDEAFNCYVHALAIEPDNTKLHLHLSSIKHYKEGDDTQFTHMQSLLSSSNLSKSERVDLCFALAKAYKDLGKKDELFKALNEGNQLRKEELNYSLDKDQEKHAIYRKLFISTPAIIENPSSYEPSTIRPIFIVGMPRSGTTLVEQIISSHHKVHGAGELSTFHKLIAPIVNNYLDHNNALSEKNFLSIRQNYLNFLTTLNVPEVVITDKSPTNFENIGFILKAFPEVKIVHLKRDPMAICWSIYQRYFPSNGLGFPYNMEDLAGFYRSYSEMMAFWHELFPNKIYDISYEGLTTNQEEETRKLLEYCELEWDENCLNFHASKRAISTASSLQVKEKMYQGSSEAWKKYETYLKPLIKSLNSI